MNLNKAIIIGNLTANPEVRNTPSGQNVATFTIATNRVWVKDGQKQEQAEFHNIVAWGKLAEIVGQYLAKGRLAMVEGRLQTRNWVDQATSVKKYRTEIIAENIQLGPRGQGSDSAGGGNFQRHDESQSASAPSYGGDSPAEEEIKVEDIPF